jgi:hypothetical protein
MSRYFHLMIYPMQQLKGKRIGRRTTPTGSTGLLFPAMTGIVFMLWAGTQATAQTADRGLQVEGLSVSGTYFAQGVPSGIATYGDVFLGSGMSVTGAATIKYTRTSAKSFLQLRALPTYGSRFGDMHTRTWDQAVSFAYSRILGSKWTMNWSGAGQIMNFDDALFADSTLTQLASNPINFENLSGAILRGNSSDPALNSTAYGSLHPDQSIQDFLLGHRTANAGAQATLTYAHSERLSVSFIAGGMLVRHLKDPSDPSGFAYPKLNSAATGINATYSLSPRTQVGVSANMVRSELDSTRLTSNALSGSISRDMSRRWFVQASLGFGSQSIGVDRHLNNRYSAGLGFRTFSHTAFLAFDRGLDDPYAVALATLEHARGLTGTWHYARPGSPWWINSTFSQLVAIYRGVPGTNTWLMAQTVGRRISRNYSIVLQGTAGRVGAKRYIQDGRQYQLEQTAIRTSFIWSPQRAPRVE